MMTLEGTFGRQVALAPIKEAIAEAKGLHPDVLVVRFECEYVPEPVSENDSDVAGHLERFMQLELARQIDPIITDEIREDQGWSPKPRLVFWIQKAEGGAGMLAFVSPDIYYTTDARHGGPALWGQMTEEQRQIERMKARSLRMGRAQGLALKGGHPVEVLSAMIRPDYVLSVDFSGKSPVFHESTSGEFLLTNDRDLLVLDAAMATRLGMSKGTVDVEADLHRSLGLDPAKVERVGRSDAIFAKWRAGLATAEKDVPRLLQRMRDVVVAPPGGYDERVVARNERKALLRDVLKIIDTYGDALDTRVFGDTMGDPGPAIQQVIDRIDQEQKMDRK